MAEAVKAVREYRSPKREAQAAATRAEIAEAARRLFVEQGYVRTTLADIAAAAGVSVPTVKLVYGTKRLILVAVWDRAIKGGPDPRPVVELEWFQQMMATPDPREHLRLLVSGAHAKLRIAPLIEVIRAAATTDEEIATLWSTMQAEYHDNQRLTIKALQRKGKLRAGLTEDTATDLIYTLNHPTVFHLLVVAKGWSPEQYQEWLGRTLIEQLLEP
jgi:AcrR family transcriptional regulator